MAIVLDGKKVAGQIKADLASRVAGLARMGMVPGLGTVLVGDDPGSMKYVEGKHRDCEEVGIASIRRQLPATATTEDVLAVVRDLNEDPACTGYIIQLPLPAHIDSNAIIGAIDPTKDADGMHPYNLGELVLHVRGDITTPLPCVCKRSTASAFCSGRSCALKPSTPTCSATARACGSISPVKISISPTPS